MKLFTFVAIFAVILAMASAYLQNKGCQDRYQVCNGGANGSPSTGGANGAPSCYMNTVNLHEGKPCPEDHKGVRILWMN